MDKQKDMFRAATDDFWDMILLNILYVFSCLLLVTYGAATAALYFTVAHLDRKREYGGAAAMYWETFKMNLRKCLVLCIAVFALLALLTLNFSIAAQFQGMLRYCSYGLQGFLLLLVQVLITVGFPLLAENGSAAVDAGKRAFGVLAEIPGRVFLACLVQALPFGVLIIYPNVFAVLFLLWICVYFSFGERLIVFLLKKALAGTV